MAMLLWPILFIFDVFKTISSTNEGLPYCNEEASKITLCSKNDEFIEFFPIVNSYVEIIDVISLDESEKTATLFVYIMLEWIDPRFAINAPPDLKPNQIRVTQDQEKHIDKPEMMFLKTFQVDKIPMLGKDHFDYFWFYDEWNGRFEFAEYLKLNLGCNFDFRKFPFDEHECDLKYFAPSYDTGMMNFSIPKLTQEVLKEEDKLENGAIR